MQFKDIRQTLPPQLALLQVEAGRGQQQLKPAGLDYTPAGYCPMDHYSTQPYTAAMSAIEEACVIYGPLQEARVRAALARYRHTRQNAPFVPVESIPELKDQTEDFPIHWHQKELPLAAMEMEPAAAALFALDYTIPAYTYHYMDELRQETLQRGFVAFERFIKLPTHPVATQTRQKLTEYAEACDHFQVPRRPVTMTHPVFYWWYIGYKKAEVGELIGVQVLTAMTGELLNILERLVDSVEQQIVDRKVLTYIDCPQFGQAVILEDMILQFVADGRAKKHLFPPRFQYHAERLAWKVEKVARTLNRFYIPLATWDIEEGMANFDPFPDAWVELCQEREKVMAEFVLTSEPVALTYRESVQRNAMRFEVCGNLLHILFGKFKSDYTKIFNVVISYMAGEVQPDKEFFQMAKCVRHCYVGLFQHFLTFLRQFAHALDQSSAILRKIEGFEALLKDFEVEVIREVDLLCLDIRYNNLDSEFGYVYMRALEKYEHFVKRMTHEFFEPLEEERTFRYHHFIKNTFLPQPGQNPFAEAA